LLGQVIGDSIQCPGPSAVVPARMAQGIEILVRVQSFPRRPTVQELYTDAYLPVAADRAKA
jgi:hypothetical protein